MKIDTQYKARKFVTYIWNNLEKSTLPINRESIEAYILSSYILTTDEEKLVKEAIEDLVR